MKRIVLDIDDAEYSALVKAKLDMKLTWRQLIYRGLGIDAKPRRMGRPTKTSLDELYTSQPWGKDAEKTSASEALANKYKALQDEEFKDYQRKLATDLKKKKKKTSIDETYKSTPWGKQGR